MAGTDIQKVREEIAQESAPFSQGQSFSSQPSAGKTMAGTDIQEVRQQNAQAERGKFNK
ncbi:gamma-type small acid-soluble spore protein [Lysinibacillus composti]|uniref:Gamma-type small acid-soluble spore protein n=2 Tax=Lysinibacillus composti TaxID=720633 RepID=A0A3N9UGJ5_9BACI|nr:gamma-type small acid-soluble spore protein [Lysinibacillus composti]